MGDSIDRAARVLVVYYSATGHVHALAKAVAEGAEQVGADVLLRHVQELAPEMLISQNQAWGRHRSEVSDEPIASLGDLEWADGIAFGTPTRFGNVAAQLKMFVDQAGQLWEEGKLINKVMTAFTSSQTDHGGQESTILALANTFYHWGAIVLPLGYTVHEVFAGGGNPYGASFTSGIRVGPPDPEAMAVAVSQGRRLARVAHVIGLAGFFVWELLLANVRVAADVLRPRTGIRPAVVAIPLDVTSDGELLLLSMLINITPGSVTIDLSEDRRTLYVHVMHMTSAEAARRDIKDGFERRVKLVFQ